jgi:hypothetical protein
MPSQDRFAPFQRFMRLMDQAKDAINRRDLVAVEVLERQVADMTSEMHTVLSAIGDRASMAEMESPMRQALEQVTLNQERLTTWIRETGAGLGSLQQGAVAVRHYGASVPLGSPVFDRRA